eukprot:2067079-Rhodomonas_salina.1
MYASGIAWGVAGGGRCPRLSGESAGDALRLCGRTGGVCPPTLLVNRRGLFPLGVAILKLPREEVHAP